MKKIRTVLGDISPHEIGLTNSHAHIELDAGAHHSDLRYFDFRLRFEDVISELMDFKTFGGKTICELTPMGLGRNPSRMVQVSNQTGVNIIVGTGIYHETFHPFYVRQMGEHEIAEMLIRDVSVGIEDTKVKAGVIGEIGSYRHEITNREKVVFRACALASLETNVAISTHTHAGELALEQASFLLDQGVHPNRLIIGHLDDRSPLDAEIPLLLELAKMGVWIQFDDIGFEYFSHTLGVQMPRDEDRVLALMKLIDSGFESQILLGSDVCRTKHLKSHGGPGFSHLMSTFVDTAIRLGLSPKNLQSMLQDNPARAFSF